jgi:hypothetical protein
MKWPFPNFAGGQCDAGLLTFSTAIQSPYSILKMGQCASSTGLLTQVGWSGAPPGPLASSLPPPCGPSGLTIPAHFPLHSHGI